MRAIEGFSNFRCGVLELAQSTILRSVGIVFLGSIVFKVIDPLFVKKTLLSLLYGMSIPLDLIVGILLLTAPTWYFARCIAIVVVSSYLGIHYYKVTESCDCFGATTLPTPVLVSFLIISTTFLFVNFVFAVWTFKRSIHPKFAISTRLNSRLDLCIWICRWPRIALLPKACATYYG